jgi:hypothetical protein
VDVSVAAVDSASHDVAVFFELTGQVAVDKDDHPVEWSEVDVRQAAHSSNAGATARVMRIGWVLVVSIRSISLSSLTCRGSKQQRIDGAWVVHG